MKLDWFFIIWSFVFFYTAGAPFVITFFLTRTAVISESVQSLALVPRVWVPAAWCSQVVATRAIVNFESIFIQTVVCFLLRRLGIAFIFMLRCTSAPPFNFHLSLIVIWIWWFITAVKVPRVVLSVFFRLFLFNLGHHYPEIVWLLISRGVLARNWRVIKSLSRIFFGVEIRDQQIWFFINRFVTIQALHTLVVIK